MKKKAEKKQYRKQSNKRAGEIYKDQGDYMKKMMIWLILIIIGLGINKNIAYGSEAVGQNDRGIEVESVTSMYPWVGIDTLEENRHENRQKKLYNLLYEISGEQEETEPESIDSKKSGIKSNMPTAEEKKELSSPVSEYFDTINLEDGITFAENTWRDYLKYYIVRIRRLDNLKVNELGSAEMGKPFLIYNVDGEQPAYVYLPIYKDRKVVHIINELEYANGHWQYGSGPMTFYFFDGDVLDQIGYLKNDCIFYSINNSCYVESKHRKLLMQKVNAEDEDVYSPEEKKFMKMSFSKKQETIDKGLSELKDVDKYCEAGDEDVRKQLTGDSEKNEAQKSTMLTAVAGIIVMVLGAVAVKIWMKKEEN